MRGMRIKSLTTAALVGSVIGAAGCAEGPSATEPSAGPTVLEAVLRAQGPPSSGGAFASPLFGLAAAPNGDLLVADAGAGIANRFGGTEISLPGVADVAPTGRGSMWAVTGGTDPTEDTGQGLYHASQGTTRLIANLFAFEAANDPDDPDGPGPQSNVDSNPFDVASLGAHALVADAGGNDLLRVDRQGNIEVVATFPIEIVSTSNLNALAGCPAPTPLCALPPELPAQPVPTSIAVGPDGAMYVGELKGFPAPTGESNIWRVAPGATDARCGSSPACSKVFDGGFTSIIDLAFGPDGRLYVSELDEASWAAVEIFGVVTGGTVNACDLVTLACEEVATGLPVHTAIAFDRDGQLWATINALTPGGAPAGAEVVAIP